MSPKLSATRAVAEARGSLLVRAWHYETYLALHQSAPARSGTVAKQPSPGDSSPWGSFHSCPDLSSLQISLPQTQSAVSVDVSGGVHKDFVTESPPYSSPDNTSLQNDKGKLRSTRRRVSNKARGVLGKVRAFHRIAAAKMAQTSIRIDTNVQAHKRGLPDDNDEDFDAFEGSGMDEERLGLDAGHDELLPPFLCLTYPAIRDKFEELEWMQKTRMDEGNLANDPSHRWALENDPEVRARNRYFNVQAWANSRIHLRVPEGECDFINASPITLRDSASGKERKYIATQGPKLSHLTHFWHMVFHESKEVGVIVMLTQTFELGREKCSQYFPVDVEHPMPLLADENDSFTHGESPGEEIFGEVKLLESTFDEASRSEIRKLELTFGSESKIIWHFLFVGWADYSKPEGEDREALIELIKQSDVKSTPENPRIVHCSAGVGRTGTFIALDHLLQELASGELLSIQDPEEDPIFEVVNQMREQRMMMVYNEMQFQFIYEIIRERAEIKLGKPVKPTKMDERSTKMAKLSNEDDYLPSPKYELEPVSAVTPLRSLSSTPESSSTE
ncbi:hypothetical protein ASPZODRAFT_12436 [Penicilliopsis zonata CBS 506.65]|uniref:Protein-tyrosine-phosphatase n=1 Tax=Penicilliopsis zonata CBS 506.65 TaxID=1073090 RepID=A0A1L9SWQ5_9EURO|nr:hypothetical protein ASPZODRAFT_12436 [Penicilliopsis zonata CBS 506.65]OJJ51620.1 hypothetical protein ASPZODRAFT_12436 [Penicilliopsis zonata CBS 506.65]